MANPDIMFRGIPRGPTRAFTAKVLSEVRPARVVIPCTGSFSLAWVAVEAGLEAYQITCGDISLYSTALGHAIMGDDFRLEIGEDSDISETLAPLLAEPIDRAVAVMYAIRVCQYSGRDNKSYYRDRRIELVKNPQPYLAQLRENVIRLRAALKGLTFKAQDMWVTMEEELIAGTVNLINPPRYSGGYDRMFAGVDKLFSWDEPECQQFTEKDYARLMDMLKDKPALSLMYYATDGADPAPTWGKPWRSVFADRPSTIGIASINWIIANNDPAGIAANRSKIWAGKPKFKMFTSAMPEKPNFVAAKMDKQTGDYYRDLFIHRLEGSLSELYVGLFIDGCLMSVIGLHMADFRRGRVTKKGAKTFRDCANLTFAFTCPNDVHARLHKLTLMSIVSSWFWDDLISRESWFPMRGRPKQLKTTMITDHPENKTARGILELDERDPQKEGGYKLSYSANVIERTREETIEIWRKKFGTLTK